MKGGTSWPEEICGGGVGGTDWFSEGTVMC